MKSSDVLLSAVFSFAAVACSVSTESDEAVLDQTQGSSIAALGQDPGIDEDPNAEQLGMEQPDVEEPSFEGPSIADPDAEEPSTEELTAEEPSTEELTAEELTAEELTAEELAADGSPIGSRPGLIPPRYAYVRALQFNLCNGGGLDCYTGKAVAEAVEKTTKQKPDVVTLNEVCEKDVATIAKAVGSSAKYRFKAAYEADGIRPKKCKNSQLFGNGLIIRDGGPSLRWFDGQYGNQAPKIERRSYVCAKTSAFYACATHFSTDRTVALAQCKELVDTKIPAMKRQAGNLASFAMGDFNLHYKPWPWEGPDVQKCVSAGHYRKDEKASVKHAGVQHFIGTTGAYFRAVDTFSMAQTDHPALQMDVTFIY